jgi:DNA-directed RNA polymerase subunit RPC12/RpoP
VDATTELRCPTCRAIDWFNDGYVIVENEATGEIVRRRVIPSDPALTGTVWSCTECGYEVPVQSRLASALNEVRIAHPE